MHILVSRNMFTDASEGGCIQDFAALGVANVGEWGEHSVEEGVLLAFSLLYILARQREIILHRQAFSIGG